MTFSSDSFSLYTSTVQSDPTSSNAALLPHPRLPTSYPFSADFVSSPSASSSPSLATGCLSTLPASSSSPDSLRVFQWNAGGLRDRSTKLLHFILSHPVDFICIQEFNFDSFSSVGSLDSLLCNLVAPTPGLAFSLLLPHMLAASSSYLSGRAYPSLNFLPPLFLCLTPTLIM